MLYSFRTLGAGPPLDLPLAGGEGGRRYLLLPLQGGGWEGVGATLECSQNKTAGPEAGGEVSRYFRP
jgi:hypothetical protein